MNRFPKFSFEGSILLDSHSNLKYFAYSNENIAQVELKLRETTSRLEQQLAEEQAARLKAEENAQKAQCRSDAEIRKLREHLEQAHEELRKRGENRCAIL